MATTFMTGSMASRTSNYSMKSCRTSKAKRKFARKKDAGKIAGFEEEYFMDSLKKIIEKSNTMRGKKLYLLFM